jgi:cytochrome c biogenesis protein CcdA
MNHWKTLIIIGIALLSVVVFSQLRPIHAQQPSPVDLSQRANTSSTIIVFVRDGCAHCEAEEAWLDAEFTKTNSITVSIRRLENPADRAVWESFTTKFGIPKVTPLTVIGNTYLVGFDTAETTGKDIFEKLTDMRKNHILTDLDSVKLSGGAGASACPDDGSKPCVVEKEPLYVSLPFFGRMNVMKYPLVIMAALLGFFDGFNPCAMWVLITFLMVLLQVGTKRRMLLFAGTFVFAEAVMYSLILMIWYKTWNFVKLDTIVTPVIGIISIIGGILFVREWRKAEFECKVENLEQRSKTVGRIKKLATDKFTILTFLGILGLAFSVNIIEFACSIGIPQAFTKIIELNHVSTIRMLGTLFVYIFFYMIDDFFVFGLALYGMDKLHLSKKYGRWSNLFGGIVMVILGILLIFRPGALQF